MEELGLLYEGYRSLGVDQTPQTKGTVAPTLAKPSLSYRNVKIGTQEPNMAADSLAGNVAFGNPYEQEEGIEGNISKQEVCNLIDELMSKLELSNSTDRVAILNLSQLKTKIK